MTQFLTKEMKCVVDDLILTCGGEIVGYFELVKGGEGVILVENDRFKEQNEVIERKLGKVRGVKVLSVCFIFDSYYCYERMEEGDYDPKDYVKKYCKK